MNLSIKTIASWAIFLLILMQFIPLNRINPKAVSETAFPEPVRKYLKKACYDCHSFETDWTGIAYIAPLSWLTSWKVASGRQALNFSLWNNGKSGNGFLEPHKIRHIIMHETDHQWCYHVWKPDAALTGKEQQALLDWFSQTGRKY
jgi:hypothetical protein